MNVETLVLQDPAAVAHEAAQRFVHLASEAVASRGRFSVALSGGSTPGSLFRLLAQEPFRNKIPWEEVHLFWGDERCVPPDDPSSNYRLAEETLIARVPIPPDNVHRVLGELEPEAAARAYTKELNQYFCGPHARFDLVLLGLGGDGHTASLFPESTALQETERAAVAVEAHYQDRPAQRVTLTLPTINAARQILFLVTGGAKAEIVQVVFKGTGMSLPAQRIQPTAGRLAWLLDAEAGSLLGA
jgi:6-phosphogluconolactonase